MIRDIITVALIAAAMLAMAVYFFSGKDRAPLCMNGSIEHALTGCEAP